MSLVTVGQVIRPVSSPDDTWQTALTETPRPVTIVRSAQCSWVSAQAQVTANNVVAVRSLQAFSPHLILCRSYLLSSAHSAHSKLFAIGLLLNTQPKHEYQRTVIIKINKIVKAWSSSHSHKASTPHLPRASRRPKVTMLAAEEITSSFWSKSGVRLCLWVFSL